MLQVGVDEQKLLVASKIKYRDGMIGKNDCGVKQKLVNYSTSSESGSPNGFGGGGVGALLSLGGGGVGLNGCDTKLMSCLRR